MTRLRRWLLGVVLSFVRFRAICRWVCWNRGVKRCLRRKRRNGRRIYAMMRPAGLCRW